MRSFIIGAFGRPVGVLGHLYWDREHNTPRKELEWTERDLRGCERIAASSGLKFFMRHRVVSKPGLWETRPQCLRQLRNSPVGPVPSDDFNAAATPSRCFDKSATVHEQKQRVQQPDGREAEGASVGDKRQVAAQRNQPQRNHVLHMKGGQHKPSGEIAG